MQAERGEGNRDAVGEGKLSSALGICRTLVCPSVAWKT